VSTARVTLRPGREKSLRQRHPWVFSGAIASIIGSARAGDTVAIVASNGEFLASAAWSPESNIRARVWSFNPDDVIDAGFLRSRIERAVRIRDGLLDSQHTGCRLVHAESDGLPGLIADRYDRVLVVQLLTAGAEAWRETLIDALREVTCCETVYERSDADVRALEGLASRAGIVRGSPPERLSFIEGGLVYRVDVAHGQKSGFYLDQRLSRARVRTLAGGREVLDGFCYSGGFTCAALAGGARSVIAIDSSAAALALARENVAENHLDSARIEWRDADVFAELRRLRDAGASFDLIVLDPPKLAPTARHSEKAARAYKDANLLALKLLRPGGRLATFSCSGGVSAELFQKIVAGAALDARVEASIVGRFGPSPDHPVALNFPEGDYLKGLLIQRTA
jgi:23S rRNA (cytosine1962-C5)-methyltransferase